MTAMTPEQFRAEFCSRTLAFLPGHKDDGRPLVIVAGPDVHSPPGHGLLMSLANQVARAHRRLVFVGELDRPLLCPDPFGVRTLLGATAGLAKAINPFLDVDVVGALPRTDALMTVGVGQVPGTELRVGCQGWIAQADPGARVDPASTSLWGALLASCLAASASFHRMRGLTDRLRGEFSLWELGRPGGSDGPKDLTPLDLGRVLQVGVGAVGSSLVFFLALLGLRGEWVLVDGDLVDVSNLNRQLLFSAHDAGYPDREPANKARVAAERIGTTSTFSPAWYGEDPDIVSGSYDLLLALANERGVRSALQARQPPVLLHATTSANWQAQFHRHIAGRDDCIDCRIPPDTPRFRCGSSSIPFERREIDAALPFLSASAALMLAAALARLQAGALAALPHNFAALDLGGRQPRFQHLFHTCRQECRTRIARS